MKKIILLALAIAFTSCSSDDSAPVNPQNNNPAEPTPAQEYKMYVSETNLETQDFTYKTKTGNGPWVEHQLQNWRFPVKLGDSVHVNSGSKAYPHAQTFVRMQLNNVVDYGDSRNKAFSLLSILPNQPINKKFKVEL